MECTICDGEFSPEKEGGVAGYIGMLPVYFCPTCSSGIYDFACQYWDITQPEDQDSDDPSEAPLSGL